MTERRVNLRDVAAAAGVSSATVSLALRGVGRVHPETVSRVRRAAAELGYVPDPAISRLASKRFHRDRLAAGSPLVFLGQTIKGRWDDPFFSYREVLQTTATALGYQPVFKIVTDLREVHRLQREWHAQGCLAVVLMQLDQRVYDLDWSLFSVVCVASQYDQTELVQVLTDVAATVELATQKVQEAGYRRIGYAMLRHDHLNLRDDRLRYGAAASLLASGDVQTDIPILASSMKDERSFREWIQRYRPDAVVGFPSVVEPYAHRAGFRIPEDVGLAVTDLQDTTNGLAGAWEHPDSVAQLAVETVDELVRRGQQGKVDRPRKILVRPDWWASKSLPTRRSTRQR